MYAIVTIGGYSDTSVDIIEHPDESELRATLKAIEPIMWIDLELIATSSKLTMNGPRETVLLLDLLINWLVDSRYNHTTIRGDLRTALPLRMVKLALEKALADISVEVKWDPHVVTHRKAAIELALVELLTQPDTAGRTGGST